MAITNLSTNAMRVLRNEIDADLKLLGNKFGVSLKLGNGKFNAQNGQFILVISTMQENGMVLSKEATAFQQLAHIYDLQPAQLGKIFEHKGATYKLAGLIPNRPKFPFVALCLNDNKTYKFTETAIQHAFGVNK